MVHSVTLHLKRSIGTLTKQPGSVQLQYNLVHLKNPMTTGSLTLQSGQITNKWVFIDYLLMHILNSHIRRLSREAMWGEKLALGSNVWLQLGIEPQTFKIMDMLTYKGT